MHAAPKQLERIAVTVPEHALERWEAALRTACDSVGFFRDDATWVWQIEGVREAGAPDAALIAAIALAEILTGICPIVHREPINAEGWVERSYARFPEQRIGRRFAVRGSHVTTPRVPGRITLLLDAGMAFGSGEHGSTRGCLVALEAAARRRPRAILDLGTGSGILAIAAARLLHRAVLAVDIEPWSVRLARRNARLNGVGPCRPGRAAGRRMEQPAGAARGALRPGVRQHSRPAARADGEALGASAGARRCGDFYQGCCSPRPGRCWRPIGGSALFWSAGWISVRGSRW